MLSRTRQLIKNCLLAALTASIGCGFAPLPASATELPVVTTSAPEVAVVKVVPKKRKTIAVRRIVHPPAAAPVLTRIAIRTDVPTGLCSLVGCRNYLFLGVGY